MESYIGAEHAVLFVVSQIAIPHFHSEKIQDQVSQNMTPKNEYFGMVRITKVVVTTDADMSQGFGTKSLTDGTTAMWHKETTLNTCELWIKLICGAGFYLR